MPEIELVKTSSGALRGFTADDEAARERYRAFVEGLEPGEFFTLTYKRPRSLAFHRKFFAMLKLAFEAWEPQAGRTRTTYKGAEIAKSFELFRKDMLILAGYGTPSYDLQGRVKWEAKSIAFDQMDDDEFAELYEAVKDVLVKHILTNYTRDDVDRVVAELEKF